MSPFLSLAQRPAPLSDALAPVEEPPRPNAPRVFAFTIRAAADPETVPRLISPFSKRGLVPKRFSARGESDPRWLTVWVETELPDERAADGIAANLRGILCVDAVLLEETRRLPRKVEHTFGSFAAG